MTTTTTRARRPASSPQHEHPASYTTSRDLTGQARSQWREAAGAVLTAGISVLATGLSRKGWVTQAIAKLAVPRGICSLAKTAHSTLRGPGPGVSARSPSVAVHRRGSGLLDKYEFSSILNRPFAPERRQAAEATCRSVNTRRRARRT